MDVSLELFSMINESHAHLTVFRTYVSGCFGAAFIHVIVDVDQSTWRQISRSPPRAKRWQRFRKICRRDESLHEVAEIANDSLKKEYITVDVSYMRSESQLTISFPQNVSFADVPPGCSIRFLRSEWVKDDFGRLPHEQQSDDVRGRGGCCDSTFEYDGENVHEIQVEFPNED